MVASLQRWQDNADIRCDVVITFEQRVFDSLLEGTTTSRFDLITIMTAIH
jgi:hypothetical protein